MISNMSNVFASYARATSYAFTLSLCVFGAAVAAEVKNQGPVIQHWDTSNGAGVYFVSAPEIPMINIQVVFNAGTAHDGDKSGLATLTTTLMQDGAGDLNEEAIADRFDSIGARFGASAQRDMATISLRSLTDPALLNPALETAALILTSPTFPADVLERERTRLLVGLKAQQDSMDDLANNALYRAVYDKHAYASPVEGEEKTVSAISRDDIKQFFDRYFVSKNATVAIVGAVSRAEAETIAQKLTAKLPTGEAAAPLVNVPPLTSSKRVEIYHPSTQTHVLFGQPGMTRNDPDYFPLLVGNHVLGGSGLVSRLADEIREKRGLSYSTYSYFAPMRVSGPYVLGLATRNDQAQMASELMLKVLSDYVAKGPTAAELKAAKQNITGSFPLRLASNSKIAEYVALIGYYKLPLDWLDEYPKKAEAVTIEQIRDAFKRRVKPDAMATVIVGGAVAAPARDPAS